MNKKVLIFTGSRADYGLLKNLIFKIKSEKKINCEVAAGSAHYSKYYGSTFKEIEKDKIKINYSVKKNFDNLSHENIILFGQVFFLARCGYVDSISGHYVNVRACARPWSGVEF